MTMSRIALSTLNLAFCCLFYSLDACIFWYYMRAHLTSPVGNLYRWFLSGWALWACSRKYNASIFHSSVTALFVVLLLYGKIVRNVVTNVLVNFPTHPTRSTSPFIKQLQLMMMKWSQKSSIGWERFVHITVSERHLVNQFSHAFLLRVYNHGGSE